MNRTIKDVVIKESMAYDHIVGIVKRHISAEGVWWQYPSPHRIGMDEIAPRKGHRDFVLIVTAQLKSGRLVILAVLEDRQKGTVVDFLRSIPLYRTRKASKVCAVICMLAIPRPACVRKEFPGVLLVLDLFHVTRAYRDGLEVVRKTELRR